MTRISQQQLESYLWGAATRLRGTIDAGDYKQFIFPLLFFKRLSDVYDEEVVAAMEAYDGDEEAAMLPENHRFQVPEGAHWSDVRDSSKDMGRAIQKAMRDIEAANPDKLAGIFGDAQWTNKDRLSDAMLRDLIEHFSSLELKLADLPEDELGNGYEYLIKKFADDSGHTAAEFYTNRTVVHLMTEMLQPQPGESIYDPTCGSGGMLLSAVAHLKNQGKEWRNVKLYGQERNLMTSSIARMNCFLHGIEEFDIQRGDTLSDPKFVKGDKLQKFDVVFANPPYSIKQWDRQAFASDKWGRNKYGTPPQGRADYAFWQHIISSMDPKTGRCAILFPHGVLFRQEEEELRRQLVEADLVECIIGLGPNLFYNSSMESCVVICRSMKSQSRKGNILLINAAKEIAEERTHSSLRDEHINKIAAAYEAYTDQPGFCVVASLADVRRNDHSLKIDLYVHAPDGASKPDRPDFASSVQAWLASGQRVRESYAEFFAKVVGKKIPANRARPLHIADLTSDSGKWPRARFGSIVRQIKETVDPAEGAFEIYVAGDHMDSESVHIRRFGRIGEGYLGPAFHRPFRKGQVLYGSRRTYLKKVAVAEFDGITANTTFVIEAIPEKLYPPLLPWIMLSDAFTSHSVRESKGSTNPYINFPDIAKFEFSLPPIAEQRKLADLLWALDEMAQCYGKLLASLNDFDEAEQRRDFTSDSMRPLVELVGDAGIRIGPFGAQLHAHDYRDEGIPVVMPSNLQTDVIETEKIMRVSPDKATELAVHQVKTGDILIPRRGDLSKRGFVRHTEEGWLCGTGTVRVRPAKAEHARTLFHALSRPSVHAWLESNAVGTTMPNLNAGIVGRIPVPWPRDIEKTVASIEAGETVRRALVDFLTSCRSLRTAVLSEWVHA